MMNKDSFVKIGLMILFLVSLTRLSDAQINSKDSVEISKEVTKYLADNIEIKFVSIEIRNLSNKELLLWFEKQNNESVSLDEKIRNYFIKQKGDFSLIQIAYEAGSTLEFKEFEMYSSFVKIIKPRNHFRLILPFDQRISEKEVNERINEIEKSIILVDNNDVKKYFKISDLKQIDYKSETLLLIH